MNKSSLQKFISGRETLSKILETAKSVDLSRTKTAISLSPLIKLRLVDTLRVVIYHNQRHTEQIKGILKRVL